MPGLFLIAILLVSVSCYSSVAVQVIEGQWLDSGQEKINNPKTTGGRFTFSGEMAISEQDNYVIDFAQGSLYEFFNWKVIDANGQVVTEKAGGIASPVRNEFAFRHGRELSLSPGIYQYQLVLESTHFIIPPLPYLQTVERYEYDIRLGNILTVFCLGIFFALAFYYLFMFGFRRSKADIYYALFITGNFIFQGTALLFFKEMFGQSPFLLGAGPILVSNMFYILFVSELLEIKRRAPAMYKLGRSLIVILFFMAVIGLLTPKYMMEIDRIGVGIFTLFGLASGILLAWRGYTVARWYLVANVIFTCLALVSILATQTGDTYSYYVEHLGLFAVTAEVLLLSFVLAFQVGQLQQREQKNYLQAKRALKVAFSDALTGAFSRRAFDRDFESFKSGDQITIIDLDGLKAFNDQYGHQRGDELLLRFSELTRINLSFYSQFYRLGGDEFAIISKSTRELSVISTIQKSIHQLREEGFENVDASYGSATGEDDLNCQQIHDLADKRMYDHKNSRRD